MQSRLHTTLLGRSLMRGAAVSVLIVGLGGCVADGQGMGGRGMGGQGFPGQAQAGGAPQSSPDSLMASGGFDAGARPSAPPTFSEILNSPTEAKTGDLSDLRLRAVHDAAVAFGAQGGLARRSFEINEETARRQHELTRIFDFKAIALTTPNGMIVMPPVISEGENAAAVAEDGQSGSSAQRVYEIVKPAAISGTAPDWRTYLMRSWQPAAMPAQVLRPRDDQEKALWPQWVREGWEMGVAQADAIFQADLDRLQRDVQGMVRYRILVAQGVVTELQVAQADLGVTKDGSTLRVADRVVRITGPVGFSQGTENWTPILATPDAVRATRDAMK